MNKGLRRKVETALAAAKRERDAAEYAHKPATRDVCEGKVIALGWMLVWLEEEAG